MATIVTLELKPRDHSKIRAILQYTARIITREQFIATMITLGADPEMFSKHFDENLAYTAEQLVKTLE